MKYKALVIIDQDCGVDESDLDMYIKRLEPLEDFGIKVEYKMNESGNPFITNLSIEANWRSGLKMLIDELMSIGNDENEERVKILERIEHFMIFTWN